jgi:hypothetical protein
MNPPTLRAERSSVITERHQGEVRVVRVSRPGEVHVACCRHDANRRRSRASLDLAPFAARDRVRDRSTISQTHATGALDDLPGRTLPGNATALLRLRVLTLELIGGEQGRQLHIG